jgi:hypothetical protein
MDKPEALRLAKNLTAPWALRTATAVDAAAELLRLHDENERLTALLADVEQVEAESASLRPHLVFCMDELRRLHAVNAELLEALKRIDEMCAAPPNFSDATMQEIARAAIARAEGEKT